MKNIKILLITLFYLFLSACSTLFDKDNTPAPTPLVNFAPEVRVQSLWHSNPNCGVGCDYLKLVPAVTDCAIFTASHNGYVTATNKYNGKKLWSTYTGILITGGPGAGDGLVVVGGSDGEVIALSQSNGCILWRTQVPNEILATPVIAQGVILIKTIDGKLLALSTQDGHVLWQYQQSEPLLILRGSSAPKISYRNTVVGFANGNLAKLSLHDGALQWQEAIAIPEGSFAIQRMIDIDADPVIFNNRIYAATYQGRIVSLEPDTGKPYWSYDISSYTGLAVDSKRVFVTDASGDVWAFDAASGTVIWRQKQLEYRNITGPALMGNYVVVGDAEGYLHWLCKDDGHFVARVRVNSSGILATPVVENNILYVLTQNGKLTAYTLR